MLRLIVRNEILGDRDVPLAGSMLVVGRDKDAQIRFPDAGVSRFHARLELAADGVTLVDLDSSNGTFVNGVRIRKAVTVRAGDRIRFGSVEAQLDGGATASGSAVPARSRPRRLAVAAVALTIVTASALLGWNAWRGHKASEPPIAAAGGGAEEPEVPAQHPEDPPEPGPPSSPPAATADPAREPETVAEPGADAAPQPAPAETPAPPRAQVFEMEGGRTLRALVVDRNAARILVREEGSGHVRALPVDEVLAIDGEKQAVDLNAVFEARLAAARDLPGLEALLAWCARRGLPEARRRVAQRILDNDPQHEGASELVGRFRHRGTWKTAEELRSAGLVDAAGRYVGTLRDAVEIRALHLALIGRPPLRGEYERALRRTREQIVDALLADPARWQARLEDAAIALGGARAAMLEPKVAALAAQLAKDGDLRAAYRSFAESGALAREDAGGAALARAWVRELLGPQAAADRGLVEAAAKMARGERVAVMGERGASAADLVGILLKQPAFFRRQVESQAQRMGRALKPDELSKASFRVAADPRALDLLAREWVASADAEERRPLSAEEPAAFIRAVYVDVLDRVPATAELSAWRAALGEGAPREAGTIALRLALGRSAAAAAGASEDPAAFLRPRFRAWLGIEAAPEQLEPCIAAVREGRAGDALCAMLLSGRYGAAR